MIIYKTTGFNRLNPTNGRLLVMFRRVKTRQKEDLTMSITIPLKEIIGKKPHVVATLLKELGIDTEKPYVYRVNALEIVIEQNRFSGIA
jgi:hypothetical protein